MVNNQINYWQEYHNLFQEIGLNPNKAKTTQNNFDKRFSCNDWQENLSLSFIKRSYELLVQYIENLIKTITVQEDEKIAKKLKFYARQFVDSIAPTNFSFLNPEVLSKTLESNGMNLLQGFKNYLEDLEHGKDHFTIKNTDLAQFKLGENIACTPGKIIYQNELMQLIQYTAATSKTYQYPLLMIPPWINKYYILDLQKENSLVNWVVNQGITVFMISWVNPDSSHKKKEFSNYLKEGPLAALNIIKQITKEEKINLLGYCIGGTLLGCMLGFLAKKNNFNVNSATFLTTLFDFREPGELGIFIDDAQLNMLEKHMKIAGYFDGRILATVFNALRANDLVWSAFVNNYLKGQSPQPFDLLYWNSDSTNIPRKVHSFYLRNMYLNNYLIESDKIKLAGVAIDLTAIKVPSYFLAAQEDHIVPWHSVYKSTKFYGGKVKFVLTASGHVAGVVNPPNKNKYGYWTNDKTPKNPEKFLLSANFNQGSWWNDWIHWLTSYSGKLQPNTALNNIKYKVIEDAPGTYVKKRLVTIQITE